jgi:hypothetical protein
MLITDFYVANKVKGRRYLRPTCGCLRLKSGKTTKAFFYLAPTDDPFGPSLRITNAFVTAAAPSFQPNFRIRLTHLYIGECEPIFRPHSFFLSS